MINKPFCLVLIFLFIMGTSCTQQINKISSQPPESMYEKVIWIDSTKGHCHVDNDQWCLKIKHNETDPWEILETDIEGFNFTVGHIYKLLVQSKSDSNNLQKIKYVLIKQLKAIPDPKIRLHDIWSLRKIDNSEVKLSTEANRPLLEIFISQMEIRGNVGCNQMEGKIHHVDNNSLSFVEISATEMACNDGAIEQIYLEHLDNVSHYVLADLSLTLFDKHHKHSLTFRKVD